MNGAETMKRIFTIMLAICLCMSACTALSEYTLTPLSIPDADEGFSLLSLSPDGGKALYVDVANQSLLITDKETGARVSVWIDYENSVDDIYGNLESIGRIFTLSLDANWSPDGRYIALSDWNTFWGRALSLYDLYVIDVQTGALVDYQTYAVKVWEENYGNVIATCFSQDSKTLYYTLIARNYGGYVDLHTLDMETRECKRISNMFVREDDGYVFCAFQDLRITPDGALVGILQAIEGNKRVGLYIVEPTWFGLRSKVRYIDKPVGERYTLVPERLFLSPITGMGLIQYTYDGNPFALSVFNSGSDYDGFDDMLMFGSVENGTAERISAQKWAEYIETNDMFDFGVVSIAEIRLCSLSPDGARALLMAAYREGADDAREYALIMLDTKTLEYERVVWEDNALLPDYVEKLSEIDWVAEDTIMLVMSNGERRLYNVSKP